MPIEFPYTTRRGFLAASATAGMVGFGTSASADALGLAAEPPTGGGGASGARESLRPFRVAFPETALEDLRRRVLATRWPDRETVSDDTQGVQLATVRALARYWATDYAWGRCEARLNAVPNLITEIDGLDFHFIHARSQHDNALPLIITHGGRARSSSSSRSSSR